MNKIQHIYGILLKEFGAQGWWPIINKKTLLCEYHVNAPRNESEALEICFGSILAQGTNWFPNVVRSLQQLKKSNLIDAKKMLETENEKLAKIIKSSGYHNQKAKKLRNFCDFLMRNYKGKLPKLFEKDIKELRDELLSVNGIGPETADSIMLYAAKKPVFVIDNYTKRIMGRVGFKEQKYLELQELFMKSLPNSEKLFNECHSLLVELGKNMCRKNPLCDSCPINVCCSYHQKRGN